MEFVVQLVVNGLMLGIVYGLIALGFVLIYKSSGVLNLAQGSLVMITAYFCYFFAVQVELPFYLAFFFTLLLSMGVGWLLQNIFLRPLIGQPILSSMMMTLAFYIFLNGAASLIWGYRLLSYPPVFPVEAVSIGGVTIRYAYLFGCGIATILFFALTFFYKYHKFGLAMRAMADDEQAALSLGVKAETSHGLAWALATMVAATAGMTLGTIQSVHYTLDALGMKAIPAAVLGGLESILGSIVGGIIIGIAENLSAGYIDRYLWGFRDIFPYLILMLVIMIRPFGLFGEKRIERI